MLDELVSVPFRQKDVADQSLVYVFSIDENMGPTWTDLLDIENTGRLM